MTLPELKPGDLLLYGPTTIWDRIVCMKTWSGVCHCEIAAGAGESLASRPGTGVNRYALRLANLVEVLRPASSGAFDFNQALEWFNKVARGQAYDWLGLLCFTLAVKQGALNKQFCSEFATNFYRAGGFEPFQADEAADRVAPATFCYSYPMLHVYPA